MRKQFPKKAGAALLELEQFLLHTAAHWQTFWCLESREYHEKYRATFQRHEWWHGTSREAHFQGAIMGLAKFLETNPQTINASHFIELLSTESDWTNEAKHMSVLLEQEKRFARDIALLRSNYYAHKSRNLSYTAMMRKTSLKYNDIPDLTTRLANMLNHSITQVDGNPINPASIAERTKGEMDKLLIALSRAEPQQ